MISAIITAGGVSRRFGSNKLFEIINDKSVIEHTISSFLPYCDEIVIPTNEQTKEFIKSTSAYDKNKITFALFGDTRQKSVYNALNKCRYKDYVLIHDGARPFISAKTIEDTITMVQKHKAVCVGVYATDTIKIVQDGKIKKTIDRKNVFQAQTPQAFEYDLIMRAHNEFASRDDFTDDSSLVEALNIDVCALVSEGVNKKITTRADL